MNLESRSQFSEMELRDIQVHQMPNEETLYEWPWQNSDLEENKDDDQTELLNKNRYDVSFDQRSRVQLPVTRRYVCCFPTCCPDRQYLTNLEYKAYELFK